MLFCIYKTKVDFAEIIKLSEIIKLVGVSGIARVSFLNGWNFQSEKNPFWISLIIAKSTHFRQQKRPFYRGFRHNNQTVRNNQTGLLKTLRVLLQSFQLFAKALRTLLAPRSNPQMGSHPHRRIKKHSYECFFKWGEWWYDFRTIVGRYYSVIK